MHHIKARMPKDLSEIEKAAFIEVEVAKRVSFDERYAWGNCREKIYRLAKREAILSKPRVKRKLICITMAELYAYVAKEFGLNVKLQRYGIEGYEIGGKNVLKRLDSRELDHVSPVLFLTDGRKILVDIQDDLHRLKTHSRPKAFGDIHLDENLDKISSEEREAIFRKAYGLTENEDFTDEYIHKLDEQTIDLPPMLRITRAFNDTRIQREISNLSCVETTQFCESLLTELMVYSKVGGFSLQGVRTSVFACALKQEGTRKRRHTVCISIENPKCRCLFIKSFKTKSMVSITKSELEGLLKKYGIKARLIKRRTSESLKFSSKGYGENEFTDFFEELDVTERHGEEK